jgi:hypothetical protein
MMLQNQQQMASTIEAIAEAIPARKDTKHGDRIPQLQITCIVLE